MSDPPDNGEQWVRGTVTLTIEGTPIEMQMNVPAGPVAPRRMLPVFQQMTSALVDLAAGWAQDLGKTVSCRAGCGACCRQLVPISEIEAHHLAALVDAMPEPRRTAIRERFAEALGRLEPSGVLARLRNPDASLENTVRKLGLEYFHQGVPCPFIEDESCSIHPDRPLASREYLVTSPAEHCRNPTATTVDRLGIPAKVSNAVICLSPPRPGSALIPFVPLVLALEWAAAHPEDLPHRPGPAIVRSVFEHLSRQAIPDTPDVKA
jgi:Fe-S-cluster containining protein